MIHIIDACVRKWRMQASFECVGKTLILLRHSSATVSFFQGTSAEQDARFYNKEKKLLKSMRFPPNIDTKVGIYKDH